MARGIVQFVELLGQMISEVHEDEEQLYPAIKKTLAT
jgi:hypothetical protein